MVIFSVHNIDLEVNLPTKQAVFNFIGQKVVTLQSVLKTKLVTDPIQLTRDLVAREKKISTGLEDGFAIPHCQSAVVKQPILLYLRLTNPVSWGTFDNSLVSHVFVILVPLNYHEKTHLNTLSQVALLLAEQKKVQALKQAKTQDKVFAIIHDAFKINQPETTLPPVKNQRPLIVGITACPVGIAHTYLAAEKLTTAITKKGYLAKIETRGSAGTKNPLTPQEIENARVVIIASDIQLSLSAISGKKFFKTSTKRAIHEPQKVVDMALGSTSVYQENISSNPLDHQKTGVISHLLTGISYMIPYVIFGGLMIALSLGLAKAIYGQDSSAPKGDLLYYLGEMGKISFQVMIGILGGYIAYSIAGRSALMPAIVVSLVANQANLLYEFGGISSQTPMGFIGAIFYGLVVGYTVRWMNQLKMPSSLAGAMPIFIIPIGVTLFYCLITIFVVGAPVSYVMGQFIKSLSSFFQSSNNQLVNLPVLILLGIIIGGMAGFDMGGPINKVAYITCTTLLTTKIYHPMGMIAAAIPIAPWGMAVATLLFPKKFNPQEKSLGISAILMGFIGISEGAIPFAIANPKKVITANVVGSAVAGGLAAGLRITNQVGHGGPIIGVLGGISSDHGVGVGTGLFFLVIIIGSLVTGLIYGYWKHPDDHLAATKTPKKPRFSFHHHRVAYLFRFCRQLLPSWLKFSQIKFHWKQFLVKLPAKYKMLLVLMVILAFYVAGIVVMVEGSYDYLQFISNHKNSSSMGNLTITTYVYGSLLLITGVLSTITLLIYCYGNWSQLKTIFPFPKKISPRP